MSKSTDRLRDPLHLFQRYVVDGRTIRELAAEHGVSVTSMHRALRRAGVPMRHRGGHHIFNREVNGNGAV